MMIVAPKRKTTCLPIRRLRTTEEASSGMGEGSDLVGASDRCAWCDAPLPAPDDVQVIVHPADGAAIETCSAACLGEVLRQGTDGLRRHGQAPQEREV